ncbi:MAG: sulfatase/phosphatase domain-containing protein, partial [Akkermansiaceae bacterium]
DGTSFLSALENPQHTSERPLFWHYPHWGNQGGTPGTVVMQGKWKLIRYYVPGRKPQLFDIEKDPSEKNNLYAKKPAITKELNKVMDKLLQETKAELPEVNPAFKKKAKQ